MLTTHHVSPQLTLTPLPVSSLPTEPAQTDEFLKSYLTLAQEVLASFDRQATRNHDETSTTEGGGEWKKGKSHVDSSVESWTRGRVGGGKEVVAGGGEQWACRRSIHQGETYEDFKVKERHLICSILGLPCVALRTRSLSDHLVLIILLSFLSS